MLFWIFQEKVCRGEGNQEECLALEPELTVLLADSTNATERLWAWEGWHRIVGQQIKPLYEQVSFDRRKQYKNPSYLLLV